uniref:uncharacterized protein LOC122611114 n=1 Tax=Erigeron canadensis TaxID=72917 RepID=UPI001CB987A5|nr:uncharacterized protein LOC122611114 [Erigeron canadensis]
MGGVAVLHPQDVLKQHHNNLFSTPVKSRRNPKPNFTNSTTNFTRSENRKRSPPTGVRRPKPTSPMVADPPSAMVAKNLVMGQVKILKRGEPLDDVTDRKVSNAAATTTPTKDIAAFDRKISNLTSTATPIKDIVSDRKVSNLTATATPTKDIVSDRKVSNLTAVDRKVSRKVTPPKKEKRNHKIEDLKIEDFALSSTDRLGPDPEMVPKQMKKNNNKIAEFFFAGSAFVDSPPPSSVPLPGFFTKSFVKEDDPSSDLRRILGLSI